MKKKETKKKERRKYQIINKGRKENETNSKETGKRRNSPTKKK